MQNFQSQVESLSSKIPTLGRIAFFPSIGSTNALAVEWGRAGSPHGSLIVADSQTDGRGRLGRPWESPAGKGLYFSLLLRPDLLAAQAPLTTLAVGLGLAAALRGLEIAPLVLKWPNDLMVAKKKLGGILTEMFHTGSKVDFLVIGGGLNVLQSASDFSPEVVPLATSLSLTRKQDWDRAELLTRLVPAILGEVNRLSREGPAEVVSRWEKESGMVGLEISFEESGVKGLGQVLGLDPDGKLRVAKSDGSVAELLAEDTTLL